MLVRSVVTSAPTTVPIQHGRVAGNLGPRGDSGSLDVGEAPFRVKLRSGRAEKWCSGLPWFNVAKVRQHRRWVKTSRSYFSTSMLYLPSLQSLHQDVHGCRKKAQGESTQDDQIQSCHPGRLIP